MLDAKEPVSYWESASDKHRERNSSPIEARTTSDRDSVDIEISNLELILVLGQKFEWIKKKNSKLKQSISSTFNFELIVYTIVLVTKVLVTKVLVTKVLVTKVLMKPYWI